MFFRSAQLCSLFALLVMLGCAPAMAPDDAETPAADGPVALEAYERDVTPFTVYDEDGRPYDHPFLGGLNTPRPQFIDINNNGRLDLFVQEVNDRLMFFENVDDGETGENLVWRTDTYMDLAVGEWFRFVDPNNDGLYDLMTEQPYSYIRYYRNVGTREQPEFEVAADTLRDVHGDPIFSDRQNIPNIADIACDNLPDLFVGRLDGTIQHYAADSFDENGVPEFDLVTDRFGGIQIIGEFGEVGMATMNHGANSMTFADYDGDGTVDLFYGDFFEPSLLLIENTGDCGDPHFYNEPEVFPPNDPVASSGYNAPDMVDWSGNGHPDLFVGVLGGAHDPSTTLTENLLYYEAQGDGTYDKITSRFLYGIDVGDESSAAFGDLTGNGAPDLLLANKIEPFDRQTSGIYFYENTGSASEPEFTRRGRLDLPDTHHYTPALGDLTGNGQLDLVAGTWRGGLRVFTGLGIGEDGLPVFEEKEDLRMDLPRGSNAVPALIDLNEDGLLSVVSGASDGTVHFFRNEGDAENPQFEYQEEYFADVKVRRQSAPAFVDLDDRGIPDLFVGTQDGELVRFRNTGEPGRPSFQEEGEEVDLDLPRYASPVFVDLYNTGVPVLISGGRGGGLVYFAP